MPDKKNADSGESGWDQCQSAICTLLNILSWDKEPTVIKPPDLLIRSGDRTEQSLLELACVLINAGAKVQENYRYRPERRLVSLLVWLPTGE
jgi:hypothetical protein